ncbi:HNH endonuclease signature motif containing protein [Agrococcus baldri]|uniref:HNH endonuclease n=1 Tax=Agrococcus baldri TaxID=153730 RepID=A0AA87USM5_9MICO|nr:HNH endonuclease signature motif containing protein [Agrococcus baldri]GEK80819.1 HNH endonuclease [Agrococcus baldri]
MDTSGIDGEDYIAAIRAGAVDPFGRSADTLQDELDAFDAEWTQRLLAMTPEEVADGAQVPPLPVEPESAFEERFRQDDQLVGRMRALQVQTARIEGERRVLLAANMQRAIDLPGDTDTNRKELAAMVAVDLGVSRRSILDGMAEAHAIVTQLPRAHEAAAQGRITTTHLRIIERETLPMRLDEAVPASERNRVEAELVDVAERLSTSRFAPKAKQIINDVLTEPLQIRHDRARQKRKLSLFDAGDGMGDLLLHAPILVVTAIWDRATQAAKGKSKDDPRTFDQFRADAVQELLLAGVVPEDLHGISSIKPQVSITIPATTLLEDEYQDGDALRKLQFPAMLDGKVLVDADTARRLAAGSAVWERLFTDPVTGVAVTVDTYRASAAQRRLLQARDIRCRMVGCSQPARTGDLDHTRDFAKGGTTSLTNLAHMCRTDHVFKHGTRWRVEQRTGGVLRWTSPIGDVIDDIPEPAGPVFTEMPRSRPKPIPLTRTERLRRQRSMLERLEAEHAARQDEPPPDPATVPYEWGGEQGAPAEPMLAPHPF